MKKIRFNTFETNSSSTHSLCMCTKETYEKWKNGETLYNIYDSSFKNKDEINMCDNWDWKSYDDDEIYEFLQDEYVTENGETIIAFSFEYKS